MAENKNNKLTIWRIPIFDCDKPESSLQGKDYYLDWSLLTDEKVTEVKSIKN